MRKHRRFSGSLPTPHFIITTLLTFALLSVLISSTAVAKHEPTIEMGISEYSKADQDHAVPAKTGENDSKSTTDHATLKELAGPFFSGPEVTKACLECHTKAGEQFIKNKHWTWKYTHPVTKQKLGKSVLVNNFCTNARGNEGMCAQCHAGYGYKDDSFDFSNQENID